MNKKRWLFLLRLVVSGGLITYFLTLLSHRHGGLGEALEQLLGAFASADLAWLVPAALLHIVGFSLISWRWKIMLSVQGIHSPFHRLFLFYFMAAFFNTFLPSTIGGDAVRALESRGMTGKTSTSILVVIVERLTGMAALVILSATATLILVLGGRTVEPAIAAILGVMAAGCVLLILLGHPRITPVVLSRLGRWIPAKLRKRLEDGYRPIASYYEHPGAVLSALAISTLFQLNMVVYYFLIAVALGQSPDPVDFLLKVPIMIFLLMTVPAINGLGIRTASFREMMKWPPAFAFSGELIDLGMRLGYGLMGGAVYLLYRRSSPPAPVAEDPKPGSPG
jgi:uncharacterized protein (TIRG00374 family)